MERPRLGAEERRAMVVGAGRPGGPSIKVDGLEATAAAGVDTTAKVWVASVLMVFIYLASAYNLIFLGRLLPARDRARLVTPDGVIFNALWCMTFWCYVKAAAADPGTVNSRWREFVRANGDTLLVVPAKREWQYRTATFCRSCGPRPERAHHCQVCGVCVLRYDHHCSFIANCVGFENHKFFLLLVIYGLMTGVFALVTSFPEASALCVGWDGDELQQSEIVIFIAYWVLTTLVVSLLAAIFSVHFCLACMGLTSVEITYQSPGVMNPFDQGSRMGNLRQVLGSPSWEWLVPVPPCGRLSDGICFPGLDVMSTTLAMLDGAKAEEFWRLWYRLRSREPVLNSPRGTVRSPRSPRSPRSSVGELAQLWTDREPGAWNGSENGDDLSPRPPGLLAGGPMAWLRVCSRPVVAEGPPEHHPPLSLSPRSIQPKAGAEVKAEEGKAGWHSPRIGRGPTVLSL
mmetsp:Transcript_56553/g.127868  ORF Transcript_56553/g.127868 Transcript_56553/m.127868 type:complete len:458 (+) Transcript_56553:65-1438(+)